MALYIYFFIHKPAKVTSDFILHYLEKVIGGRHHSEKFKNKYWNLDIFFMDLAPGIPGVSKYAPGSKEVHELAIFGHCAWPSSLVNR